MVIGKFVLTENGEAHQLVIEEAYLELSAAGSDWGTITVSANSDELPVPATLTIKHVHVSMSKPFERSVPSLSPDIAPGVVRKLAARRLPSTTGTSREFLVLGFSRLCLWRVI